MPDNPMPTPRFRVGLNPLPWVLTPDGFQLTEPVLRRAFGEIAGTPFRGIHADPPAGDDAATYRALLAEYGLVPAPGYFAADFGASTVADVVDSARRHAALQAQLGNTETFLAGTMDDARLKQPALGAGVEAATLSRVVDTIGAAAEAITAEGVRPALHSHVGTLIETERELRAVLDAVPASQLGFGPDTGHLTWAGMDPAAVMAHYADRIAAVHLKDVHVDQAQAAREAGADYVRATSSHFTIWTEPGRGDVDLPAALAVLPDTFTGWVIVEVDVPEAPTNLESTQISARWITEKLGADVFGGGR
jgi:inosose dehydratase